MHHRKTLLLAALLSLPMLLLAGCGPSLIDRATNFWSLSCCGALIVILDVIALIELAGSTRSTSDKVIWALVIIFFPVLGCVLYYLFGRR